MDVAWETEPTVYLAHGDLITNPGIHVRTHNPDRSEMGGSVSGPSITKWIPKIRSSSSAQRRIVRGGVEREVGNFRNIHLGWGWSSGHPPGPPSPHPRIWSNSGYPIRTQKPTCPNSTIPVQDPPQPPSDIGSCTGPGCHLFPRSGGGSRPTIRRRIPTPDRCNLVDRTGAS